MPIENLFMRFGQLQRGVRNPSEGTLRRSNDILCCVPVDCVTYDDAAFVEAVLLGFDVDHDTLIVELARLNRAGRHVTDNVVIGSGVGGPAGYCVYCDGISGLSLATMQTLDKCATRQRDSTEYLRLNSGKNDQVRFTGLEFDIHGRIDPIHIRGVTKPVRPLVAMMCNSIDRVFRRRR
jgi:hypothetical protein